jgi:hypothetical protein
MTDHLQAQTKKASAATVATPAIPDTSSQPQAPVDGETVAQDATAMPPPARKRRHSHSTDPVRMNLIGLLEKN